MNGQPVSRAAILRKTAIVAVFALGCAAVFSYLWVNSGGKVPLSQNGYTVSATLPKVANLVYFSDVMEAGVKVGKVTQISAHGDRAHITMQLDNDVAPLHKGATFQVKAKSLVEESYIQIKDGRGAVLPSGTALPASSVTPYTQLSDVLNSFTPKTRANLRRVVRESGLATKGTMVPLQSAVMGLGKLGRNGSTVIDAIAAQSDELRQLTRSSTRVLATLSTRRTELRSLIADADQVTRTTAGQQLDLRRTVRALPPLMDAARGSSGDLERLGGALTPVAQNLSAAAPDLTAALRQLPATARQLRMTMPSLNRVLDRAPATLQRVPKFSTQLRILLPDAGALLTQANPMLAYVSPYNRDVAAFFANFAAVLGRGDAKGKFLRIMPGFNEQSYKGFPVSTNIGPLNRSNPLPKPGSLQQTRPFSGTYPHVRPER